MKKMLFPLVLIVLIILGFYYGKKVKNPTVSQPQIVVSSYVPYTLAKQLSGGQLNIEMLLPPNAEPHAFEPSPGSLVQVHRAAAFVYVSNRLEPWARDVLGAAGQNTRVVELAAELPVGEDPHVWMDFGQVIDMARRIEALLAEIDPAHATDYRANLAGFETEIAVLDRDFANSLVTCQHREIVHIGHLAFGALAKRYHLSITALAGTSHDGEHSAHKLADLVKHIRAKQVKTLFTEEAVSPRLAEAVATETGAEMLPLYTIEHVSKTDFDSAVTYAQLMQRNLKSLKQGLVCRS
ncbi:MAG: zinc ABC transporter substrate-binding protein [Elusimicrobiaceae bacterium]|nr:zinc ABC transporter substrate-binding protein [Elusimicrobiaceae bacterium]